MSKQSAPRRVGDKEALAVGTMIRGSAQKLNLVAQLIRGRKVEEALNILKFSPKGMAEPRSTRCSLRRSPMPRTTITSTSTAWSSPRRRSASRSRSKRFATRARGRSTRIEKPFSRLRVVVREQEEA